MRACAVRMYCMYIIIGHLGYCRLNYSLPIRLYEFISVLLNTKSMLGPDCCFHRESHWLREICNYFFVICTDSVAQAIDKHIWVDVMTLYGYVFGSNALLSQLWLFSQRFLFIFSQMLIQPHLNWNLGDGVIAIWLWSYWKFGHDWTQKKHHQSYNSKLSPKMERRWKKLKET